MVAQFLGAEPRSTPDRVECTVVFTLIYPPNSSYMPEKSASRRSAVSKRFQFGKTTVPNKGQPDSLNNFELVPGAGLEPALLLAEKTDFKSVASAGFATRACLRSILQLGHASPPFAGSSQLSTAAPF